MPLLWSQEYSLGIEVIDVQHKQFVQALSNLIGAVGDVTKHKTVIDSTFDEINRYIDIHFTTEERYFDTFQYEGTVEHKAEHEKFRKKIRELKEQYKTHTIEASFNLADFLEDWLITHLKTMDSKYVACFHEHGL